MTERQLPTIETERPLSQGLDYYKLTMGQLALERFPDAEVTFTLKNRAGDYPLTRYVAPEALEARLRALQTKGFTAEEIAYFAGLEAQQSGKRFDEPYLTFLSDLTLTNPTVGVHEETGDLTVEATGSWANVSLWETVVMSELNEVYYEGLIQQEGLAINDIWAEGDRRLDEKVAKLKDRPDIKIADFGTRRRFSAAWQEHVLARLAGELPDNLVGTSNPWLAYKHNLTPIGTYAHEMPMVYAAIEDADSSEPLDGHTRMMRDWYARYGNDLSVALTDTFTTDFFFADFTGEQARQWRGFRHDSGDPFIFGDRAIDFYKANDVDPQTKTIVFSDGLDIDTIIELADYFKDKVNVLFGWGTSLMNDVGLRPNNFVMKATHVNEKDTVKLSDDTGKHTGPRELVARYQELVAVRQLVEAAYEKA